MQEFWLLRQLQHLKAAPDVFNGWGSKSWWSKHGVQFTRCTSLIYFLENSLQCSLPIGSRLLAGESGFAPSGSVMCFQTLLLVWLWSSVSAFCCSRMTLESSAWLFSSCIHGEESWLAALTALLKFYLWKCCVTVYVAAITIRQCQERQGCPAWTDGLGSDRPSTAVLWKPAKICDTMWVCSQNHLNGWTVTAFIRGNYFLQWKGMQLVKDIYLFCSIQ